jgi:acyl-CoA synthetase (AMP-forming)/AMP-acid ligase II/acyl carrier protein
LRLHEERLAALAAKILNQTPMKLYDTLADMLEEGRSKDRHILLINGEKDESRISFAELSERAHLLLGSMQQRGMMPGDEVVVFSKSNERFLIAFWAAILGGIVPVPVAVGISDEHRFKLFRILKQLRNGRLYTDQGLLDRLLEFAVSENMPDVKKALESNTILEGDIEATSAGSPANLEPDQLAFIQYSSGSTNEPKGICLTHRNLATNIRASCERLEWDADDQSLSWMPLTHDMGLIGYHLTVYAAGMNQAVMDTSLFVRRPLLWLSKASEIRATQLCSPNFGYKHFLKLFKRKGLDNLDLSAVKLILNGAEPISYELCEEFLSALAPHGLRRSAMFPVYGLAEATVGVTYPKPGTEYSRITVDRHKLRIGSAFEPKDPGDADAISFVKVGTPIRDCEVRIVDDDDQPLDDGLVGNIDIRGGNVTQGLYHNDEEQAKMYAEDGWLRTGDCGVFIDEQLVITGRSKDIIIVNGQNYYPHDIEEVAARIDGLDLGKVVVAGVNAKQSQTEEVLAFVLYRKDPALFVYLAYQVSSTIGSQIGIEVDHVIPVSRIPKTTSGKIQRAHLVDAYLNGEYDDVLPKAAPERLDDKPEDDNTMVAQLSAICREFAQDRSLGPDDNLFEVGISSLTLTEIVLALEEKYPGKVDINDLFDYPTIRELAAFIEREEATS